MAYDFDTVVNRANTNSVKHDFAVEHGFAADVLPLWVADMDFAAPPEVTAALLQAAAHGVYGYTAPKPEDDAPVLAWFLQRFGFEAAQRHIVKTPGVVFALAQAVRAFSRPGEGVLIQTPVYYPFYNVIRQNNRRVVKNPLKYENGKYFMDFEDLERKIVAEHVRLFILCSPHNPVGRVWTREELTQLHEICRRHGVLVVADEIHCDFVYQGFRHTCYGVIDEGAVLVTAPSKTFNLAGLQLSNLFIKDDALRARFCEEMAASGYSMMNLMGLAACRAAYAHGGPWLAELLAYLAQNLSFARAFLAEHLPRVKLVEPEGTYLLWLDFAAYGLPHAELDRRMAHGAKLWLDEGTMFGPEGAGFERVNIACPRATLAAALARMAAEF